jgi:tetratricopeptide (TPR) repeat protein
MRRCFCFYLAVHLLLSLTGCAPKSNVYRESLEEMERGSSEGQELSRERVAEIEEGIRKYRREVERKVKAADQLGTYYKMLAVQYLRARMYGKAYESLELALELHPENQILFHLCALSAAHIAKSKADEPEKNRWLATAETFYLRALELDPLYADALYGYAVLLIFELDRPREAETYLDTLLARESSNVDAMFLKARILYTDGRLEEAVEIYDRIAGTTSVRVKKERALANKQKIIEELYGAE